MSKNAAWQKLGDAFLTGAVVAERNDQTKEVVFSAKSKTHNSIIEQLAQETHVDAKIRRGKASVTLNERDERSEITDPLADFLRENSRHVKVMAGSSVSAP